MFHACPKRMSVPQKRPKVTRLLDRLLVVGVSDVRMRTEARADPRPHSCPDLFVMARTDVSVMPRATNSLVAASSMR
jgi:hypothetical protein